MSTPAAVQKDLAQLRVEFEKLSQSGEVNDKTAHLIQSLLALLAMVVMLFVEKNTRKSPANSGLPSSKTGKDKSARPVSGSRGKGREHEHFDSDNVRLEQTVEVSKAERCNHCGQDLTRVKALDHERRTLVDIVFVTTEHHVDAQIKCCPACKGETRGEFPEGMYGPLQYGTGIIAFAVHLLVSQMVAVRRSAQLLKAMTGRLISEATLMAWVMRVYHALDEWEAAAVELLLQMPVMHVDETSMRINKKNHWMHSYSSGNLVVKFCHRKRGTEAINEINIIPRYGAGRSQDSDDEDDSDRPVLVHDRWAAYFTYTNCLHALCGSHLLRDLEFVINAHDHRWARRMQKLLCAANREVSATEHKVLCESRYKAVRKQYRTILTQGERELPPLPERTGKRGQAAKTKAHNLHEAFRTYETEILRFARNSYCPFTNNQAERSVRMTKVKLKVSGTFRSVTFAKAYCRISSYLDSMSMMGYSPIAAIQIALQNKATDILNNND